MIGLQTWYQTINLHLYLFIPSGLYDEHCVHKFPCVGSGWAGVHLNTTGQSRSTSPLVPDLWIAGCWLADGDVTDDRDPWCWICVNATQKLSGWLWHSLIAQCNSPMADSENLDFVAPLEEHRFHCIFCFFGSPAFILKMCPKDPLRTISCSRS